MADFSEDDCLAIQRYPLNLDSARGTLKTFVANVSDSQSSQPSASTQDDSDGTEADEDSGKLRDANASTQSDHDRHQGCYFQSTSYARWSPHRKEASLEGIQRNDCR
jgi:hypothetical protein